MKNTIVLSLSLIAWTTACGPTLGHSFRPVAPAAQGEATLYVYRPSRFVGGGVAVPVSAAGRLATMLYNGGYRPLRVRPGELELSAVGETSSVVRLHVKPGGVYYVRGRVLMGTWAARVELTQVPADVGAREIAECRLIPAAVAGAR